MALYESAHTRFMRDWLKAHPEELQQREAGRALWWDKPPRDPDSQRRIAEAQAPRKAYCYDVD